MARFKRCRIAWVRTAASGADGPTESPGAHDARGPPGRRADLAYSKAGRLLPLSPAVRDVLARRLAARFEGCPLVFHHAGRPIGDWRKRWAKASGRRASQAS
jgi:hypothetical protein